MVAVEQVASRESVDYRELVREVISRCIARSRMSKGQFAAALSMELEATTGRRGPIHPTQISKWLSGVDLPKSDVLLAAMKLAGYPANDLLTELDPILSSRARLVEIERRLGLLERGQDGERS